MSQEVESAHEIALKQVAAELAQLEESSKDARRRRESLMWQARQSGLKYIQIANCLGVTKAYVHQVVARIGKETNSDS